MGPSNPIENVVIVVKENHSFDNYFGTFPGVNGASLPAAQDPPAGGDPRHDHVAWLERATGAVKQQYQEWRYTGIFRVCAAVHPVRQLLHRSGEPIGAEPSDVDCGGFTGDR
jgi:phospholipase C